MLRTLIFMMTACVAATLCGQSPQKLGSIAGTVTGVNGQAIGGARVNYLRHGPLNMAAPPPVRTVTNSAGAFTLNGLPAGTYAICVLAGSGWLDPCFWSAKLPATSLLPGQNRTGLAVQLQKSATLQIQVSDTTGAVAANEKTTAGGALILGVWTGRHQFKRTLLANQNGTNRTYQVPVPQGVPFHIGMVTSLYQVQDDTGAAVMPGIFKSNYVVPANAPAASVNLHVIGVASK